MKHVHFIGIGGIGLSALARFLKERGYHISGSDLKSTKTTKELEAAGIKVYKGHDSSQIKGAKLIIYSAAIKEQNPEYQAGLASKIPCLSRKQALPLILNSKKIISIAGAHGKSTTSSILASLIDAAVIIGAILKEYNSNMIYKNSDKIIFEADESDSSFLNSNPFIAVVTNVDEEHLEHYDGNYCLLKDAYKQFLEKSSIRVINAEDEYLSKLDIDALRLYPSKDIKNIKTRLKNKLPFISFELQDLGRFELLGLGFHTAINAALAILVALMYEDISLVRQRLLSYKGIKKRFDILLADDNMALIDDYAHHPREIEASLNSAYEYAALAGYEKVIVIFEPHKYSRFLALKEDFVRVLKRCDELYILPVYAASEAHVDIDFKVFKNATLVKSLKRKDKSLVINDEIILNKHLIIGFGAGDVSSLLRGEYV